jgi:hypothetical protein
MDAAEAGMSLEKFRLPRTPESRTPYVVAILVLISLVAAAVRALWRLLVG